MLKNSFLALYKSRNDSLPEGVILFDTHTSVQVWVLYVDDGGFGTFPKDAEEHRSSLPMPDKWLGVILVYGRCVLSGLPVRPWACGSDE